MTKDDPAAGEVTVHTGTGEVTFPQDATRPFWPDFCVGTHAYVIYEPGPPKVITSVTPYNPPV